MCPSAQKHSESDLCVGYQGHNFGIFNSFSSVWGINIFVATAQQLTIMSVFENAPGTVHACSIHGGDDGMCSWPTGWKSYTGSYRARTSQRRWRGQSSCWPSSTSSGRPHWRPPSTPSARGRPCWSSSGRSLSVQLSGNKAQVSSRYLLLPDWCWETHPVNTWNWQRSQRAGNLSWEIVTKRIKDHNIAPAPIKVSKAPALFSDFHQHSVVGQAVLKSRGIFRRKNQESGFFFYLWTENSPPTCWFLKEKCFAFLERGVNWGLGL